MRNAVLRHTAVQDGERSMDARAFSPAYQRGAVRAGLPERAAVIALLVLLHVALFWLLQPQFGVPSRMPPLNEIWLTFHPPNARETASPAIHPVFVRPKGPVITPPVILSPSPLAPPAAAPNVTGLGRSLFDCDLANSQNLSAEQRANCLTFRHAPSAAGTAEAGMPKGSRAKHSRLWAAELSARQKPPEVPCTHIEQQVLGGPGVQKPVTAVMADPLCLLNGLLDGFHNELK